MSTTTGQTTLSGGVGGGTGGGCVTFSATADQAPAAMLIVLDASSSMGTVGKWAAAQTAIPAAIDKDVFDSMSVGLLTFPNPKPVMGPQCLFGGFIQVQCGYSALPQVPLALAGKNKSNAGMGVRSAIYKQLADGNQAPQPSGDDGSPVYDAMVGGYNALKLYPNVDKRILVLISDGGFSCTSLSSPQRPAYNDANECPDWENPDNVNKLIKQKYSEGINTFVVGVPGTDTNGGKTGSYDNPPYQMLLALSTYAVNGSPNTVPADCDKGAQYSQNGGKPAKPCHFDMSQGNLDPSKLAEAIAKIRGAAVGCTYPLPKAPMGQEIDLDKVNVLVTTDGNMQDVLKRSSPSDMCTNDGCWDYDDKKPPNVIVVGKTCENINKAGTVDVKITFGCSSKIK
jgi:hypothetical protein